MEVPLINAFILIATGSAVIKLALIEWEGIVHAWLRLREHKPALRICNGVESEISGLFSSGNSGIRNCRSLLVDHRPSN